MDLRLFLICLAVFGALGLVVWQWNNAARVLRWASAPWRNDQHRYLSLTRMVFTALVLSLILGRRPVIGQEFFWKYNGWVVVCILVLALLADIITSKGGLAVLLALAGNKASAIPDLSLNVPGLSAGVQGMAGGQPVPVTTGLPAGDVQEGAG